MNLYTTIRQKQSDDWNIWVSDPVSFFGFPSSNYLSNVSMSFSIFINESFEHDETAHHMNV